jgi:PUA-domain protein
MMKRKRLSKKEIKDLNEQVKPYNHEFDKKAQIELVEDKYFFVENELSFFLYENTLLPTLKWQLKNGVCLPTITVDQGAIKFVIKGADIMRPGITNITSYLENGTIVTIIDENKSTPIAIGKMLLSSSDMQKADSGKVVGSVHYFGDDLWKMEL